MHLAQNGKTAGGLTGTLHMIHVPAKEYFINRGLKIEQQRGLQRENWVTFCHHNADLNRTHFPLHNVQCHSKSYWSKREKLKHAENCIILLLNYSLKSILAQNDD